MILFLITAIFGAQEQEEIKYIIEEGYKIKSQDYFTISTMERYILNYAIEDIVKIEEENFDSEFRKISEIALDKSEGPYKYTIVVTYLAAGRFNKLKKYKTKLIYNLTGVSEKLIYELQDFEFEEYGYIEN